MLKHLWEETLFRYPAELIPVLAEVTAGSSSLFPNDELPRQSLPLTATHSFEERNGAVTQPRHTNWRANRQTNARHSGDGQ